MNAIFSAKIEELIKTNQIEVLIKTDQQKWDACLIKNGDSYVMDAYGLPKQQCGVQQPDWVYKRREYLKSLSVAKRNFILTGDEAFTFDPVPYTVIYDCFTYADIVRGPAPVQIIEPPQVVQNQVQVNPVPVQVIKPPQVVQNSVQVNPVPVQNIKPLQVVQNPVQVNPAPVQVIKPPQVVQNPTQLIPAPEQIIVPAIVRQPTPDPDLADIPELEDDSNPASPDPPNLLKQPLTKTQPQPVQPEIPVPLEFQKVIQKVALHNKIVGFGAKEIQQAQLHTLQLEKEDRLAELELIAKKKRLAEREEKQLEHRERTTSDSSDSSNYDTPLGSPAPSTSKVKGKLKKNIDQVTNALSFSFSDSRLTRASFRKKEGKGWPPKS